MQFLDLGDHELACCPVPQTAGGEKYVTAWARYLIGFTKDDTHDQAVTDFVKYFTTPDVAAKWMINYGGHSPYNDVITRDDYKEYVANNIALQALVAQNDYSGSSPSISGSSTAYEALSTAVKQAATGVKSAEEALKAAKATANNALGK